MTGRMVLGLWLVAAIGYSDPKVIAVRPDQRDVLIDAGTMAGLKVGDQVCVNGSTLCGKVSSALAASSYVAFASTAGIAAGMPTCKPETQASPTTGSGWGLAVPKIRLPTAELDFFPLYTISFLFTPQTVSTNRKLAFVNGLLVSQGASSQAPYGGKLSVAFPLGTKQLLKLSLKAKSYRSSSYSYPYDPVTSVDISGQEIGGSIEWAPLNAKIGSGWVSAAVGVDAEESKVTVKTLQSDVNNSVVSALLVGSVVGSIDYFLPVDADSFISFGGSLLIPLISSEKLIPEEQVVVGEALGHSRSGVALELSIGYSFK